MFKLYFLKKWDNFDTKLPCPWEVIKLSINHKEGHIAKASLMVARYNQPQAAFLVIYEDDTLLFQGMLSGQFSHSNNLTTIDVLCISPNFEADLGTLLKSGVLEYDKRFFQNKQPKACDHLEACNELFYWQRTSGKLGLSNYFKGSKTIDIGGNYLEKSLNTQQINMPLGKAILQLKVVWTQKLEGSFNATPYIARGFANGVIATLTPKAITHYWPKAEQRLGIGKRQSGYRVERSSISEIAAETIGGALAQHTRPFCQKDGDGEKMQRCKIYYFKTDLKISWQYQQTREELLVLQAALNHEQHLFTNHKVRQIPIAVHLPVSEQAMFFETKQGEEFIAYATKIIHCQLHASARCMRVVCKLPWELGRDLTVDDSISLKTLHHQMPNITGKITQLYMVADGLQRFVEITLGCVVAKGDLQDQPTIANEGYANEICENTISSTDALIGITYSKLNPQGFN